MNAILSTILNYLYVFLKIILFAIISCIPAYILIKIFSKKYDSLRKKKSVFFSLTIIIYIVSLVVLLLIYFIPTIPMMTDASFIDFLKLFFYHFLRLIFINIIFTGLYLSYAFLVMSFNDNFNKKLKKTKHKKTIKKNLNLVKSLSLTNIIVFILILVFPKLIPILLYLIFL